MGDDENAAEYFLSELFVLIMVNVHEGWLWEMLRMLRSIFVRIVCFNSGECSLRLAATAVGDDEHTC